MKRRSLGSIRVVSATVMLVLAASGCNATDRAHTFDSFRTNGVEYEFVSIPNDEGPDAPCVGVTARFEDHTTTAMACPTDDAETDSYGAVIEVDAIAFVVGYGLAEAETIEMPNAARALSTEAIDGRRFFLLELQQPPPPGTFEVVVATPDGATRSIPSYGPTR
jgi:hypothetical protein